jgi:hypothetical protein
MKDIFDGIILCKNCRREMKKGMVIKEGFKIRYAYCPKCHEKLWHHGDLENYRNFSNLKKKEFKVKLRIVGNSYAITLPKEIVNFIKEVEKEFSIREEETIKLIFDELGKLKVIFEQIEKKINKIKNSI